MSISSNRSNDCAFDASSSSPSSILDAFVFPASFTAKNAFNPGSFGSVGLLSLAFCLLNRFDCVASINLLKMS